MAYSKNIFDCASSNIYGCFDVTLMNHIYEDNEFNTKLVDTVTKSFNFKGKNIQSCLREFLQRFKPRGNVQMISNFIDSFSTHFFNENPCSFYAKKDSVYTLSFSIVMLHSDAHNTSVKNKMTFDQYRRALTGVNDGNDFPIDVLDKIYNDIVSSEFNLL